MPFFIIGWFASAIIGWLIGKSKNRGGAGFLLGALLGPIGWIVVFLLSGNSSASAPSVDMTVFEIEAEIPSDMQDSTGLIYPVKVVCPKCDSLNSRYMVNTKIVGPKLCNNCKESLSLSVKFVKVGEPDPKRRMKLLVCPSCSADLIIDTKDGMLMQPYPNCPACGKLFTFISNDYEVKELG